MLLCYVAMTHKMLPNSKIAVASQNCGISWTVVGKYAKLQGAYLEPSQTSMVEFFCKNS